MIKNMLKVIGIGNRLRGDDGVGPAVIEILEEQNRLLPFMLIDAGADAFTLLDHLIGSNPLLIVDCARMGRKPGDVCLFDVDDVSIEKLNNLVSLHSYGFAQIYGMARQLGPVTSCKVLGVEPLELTFDTAMSPEVEKSIPKIIELIYQEAGSYVKKNSNN